MIASQQEEVLRILDLQVQESPVAEMQPNWSYTPQKQPRTAELLAKQR